MLEATFSGDQTVKMLHKERSESFFLRNQRVIKTKLFIMGEYRDTILFMLRRLCECQKSKIQILLLLQKACSSVD